MHWLTRISLSIASAGALTGALFAQYPGLTLPPSGKNQKAMVTQFIGPVRVSIQYSSPAVHGTDGKDRRGQIWGKLVPYGMADSNGFGNGKPFPWRAGANENTVFEVSDDVEIEGKTLPAGRYGLLMIPGEDEWTIVFSKNSSSWGSFFYDPADDALRVTVKPHKNDYREWLTYEFTERKPAETTAELQWEDLAVPIGIKVNNIDDIYVTRLHRELGSVPGFSYEGYMAAAQYCLNSNTHLEDGLKWADDAIGRPFIGQENFNSLSTKALILAKMGKQDEAMALMRTAIHHPTARPTDIHQYARQLLAQKKTAEAVEVFKYNAEKNGDAWPVHVGLMRAYAATGDNTKALEQAKIALGQAPDPLNKKSLEDAVRKLSSGGTIDQ